MQAPQPATECHTENKMIISFKFSYTFFRYFESKTGQSYPVKWGNFDRTWGNFNRTWAKVTLIGQSKLPQVWIKFI